MTLPTGPSVYQAEPGAEVTFSHSLADGWSVKGSTASHPRKGHDAVAIGLSSVAVVDGATPLADDWPQDLDQFARIVAEALVMEADGESSPVRMWDSVSACIREQYPNSGMQRTAAASVVSIREDSILLSVLGDVSIRYRQKDGWRCLDDFRLRDVTSALADVDDAGSSDFKTRVRALSNRPDGYPIIGAELVSGSLAITRRIDRRATLAVIVMSDGALFLDDEASLDLLAGLPEFGSGSSEDSQQVSDDASWVALICP